MQKASAHCGRGLFDLLPALTLTFGTLGTCGTLSLPEAEILLPSQHGLFKAEPEQGGEGDGSGEADGDDDEVAGQAGVRVVDGDVQVAGDHAEGEDVGDVEAVADLADKQQRAQR